MHLRILFNLICLTIGMVLINSTCAFAQVQDIGGATNDFSTKILTFFKGPLVKILSGVVLFVGVGGLLRGKHSTALSCGIAFILLLLLPVVLQYFGDGR